MSEINIDSTQAVDEAIKAVEDVANNNANLAPEEIAATFFKNYYPTYKLLISKLNRKDAIRLADALIGWPLEMNEPKFFNDEGKRAFWIANQLLDCKLVMRSAVEIDLINQAEKQKADAETSVDNNDAVTEGENTNG